MSGIFTINQSFIRQIYGKIREAIYEEKTLGFFFNKIQSNKLFYEDVFSKLSYETLESVIETCFVASLEKEENKSYNFLITIKPPNIGKLSKFLFHKTIDFNVNSLTKLAPAINPNNQYIGVWLNELGNLSIWGFGKKEFPNLSIFSSSPGKIILDCSFGPTEHFRSFISMIETGFITTNTYFDPVNEWLAKVLNRRNHLFYLLHRHLDFSNIFLSMFNHGNGGTIILVPKETGKWTDSIQQPILYKCKTAYQDIRIGKKYSIFKDYERKISAETKGKNLLEKFMALNAEIDNDVENKTKLAAKDAEDALLDVAGLTKIDGATILSHDFKVLAFGAKIKSVDANVKPEVLLVGSTLGYEPKEVSILEIGGTRHQSAAQFVFDQKDCLAIVASHDGKLSILKWNERHNMVVMVKHYETIGGRLF